MRIFLLPLACVLGLAQTPPPGQAQPPTQRDSIVVTGTFEPIPLEEADRAVSAIKLGPDQKALACTVFDYLRLDPSIDVRGRAPNGIQTDVSIRGGNFGQTLVLLNGFRLNDAQSAHHNLDIPVTLESLGRMEILKGTGSSFYGSDAVGGVVNLLTQTPEANELTLRTAIGNFGVNQESASLATVWNGGAEHLSFSRDFSTGFLPDRDYRNLAFTSVTHLKSRLGFTDVTLAMADKPFGADQFYGKYNSWERTRTWFASLRQSLGENTELDFGFRRHTDLFVLFRDNPAYFTNRHAVEGYQAALRRREHASSNVTISYGLEGYRDEIISNNLGNHQRNWAAAYAAVDVRALNRFSFTLGGREEIYHGGARQFNPTAAFGAWLAPHWRVRVSAGRSFRLPSYTDLYYHDPSNLGSPYLKPETAWSYDTAIEWNGGGRVKADAGFFYRAERNDVDYIRSSPTDIWRAANFNDLHFSGVEAGVTIRPASAQTLEFRYTALHGAETNTTGLTWKYTFNYPSNDAVATWQAKLPGGFLARTRIGVVQRYQSSAYALWDAYLADRRGRWTPFAQFTNIANTHYSEVLGVVMPTRAAVVGIEWRTGF
jgi:iron complex outermembrane receptor protein